MPNEIEDKLYKLFDELSNMSEEITQKGYKRKVKELLNTAEMQTNKALKILKQLEIYNG